MPKFVVQEHHATRLHWDFRLERDGVLKSWAIPKGPPLEEGVKRLAMMVPDHPLDYENFEGTIPEGDYGAGEVKIWDKGTYEIQEELEQGKAKKKVLKVVLHGKKLKGLYTLVEFIPPKNWLLLKG